MWSRTWSPHRAPFIARVQSERISVNSAPNSNNLLSLPVRSRELHHVRAALYALFQNLGAPLVLKSDCEFDTSRFDSSDEDSNQARQKLAALLAEHGVSCLRPITPEYNAAIEAGIGSFQTRIPAAAPPPPRGRPAWSRWRMELRGCRGRSPAGQRTGAAVGPSLRHAGHRLGCALTVLR